MELNSIQYKIAHDFIGNIAVVAGPGSGKTKTLIERAANIFESGENPQSILLISYTNKIRGEIKDRLKKRNIELEKAKVHTFHSFGIYLLRKYGIYVAINNNFDVIDDADKKTILKEIYKELDISTREYPIKQMLYTLDGIFENKVNLLENSMNVITYLNNLKQVKSKSIEETIFNYFVYYKRQNNYLEFEDILVYTNALLYTNEAQKIIKDIKYIMVDEAQDLNSTQYEFIELLGKNYKENVLLVGDFDQNIYSWRGARVDLFKQFYDNAKHYELNINYRSTPEIVKYSKNLILNNKNRINVDLKSNNGSSISPIFNYFKQDIEEVNWIAKKIKSLIESGANPSDIAILYRANYLSRTIESELVKNGIDYTIYNGFEFYSRIEIKDTISLLKALINPEDKLSWERILLNLSGIGPKKIDKIMSYEGKDVLDKLNKVIKEKILGNEDNKNIIHCMSAFDEARKKKTIEMKLTYLIESLNYKNIWDDGSLEERLENYSELLRYISTFDHENLDVKEFLDNISLLSKRDEHTNINEQIKLMTLHSSKGLEFKYVFIMHAVEGILPNARSIEENLLEEERRLMYVGMTRSKEYLYITASPFYGYTNTYLEVSRFVKEAGININEIKTDNNYSTVKLNSGIDNHNKKHSKSKSLDYIEILLTLFLGMFGLQHFYKKRYVLGILYLFTGGVFFIGWFYDCYKILKSIR